ncbi:MAG: DUF2909 domain-containing protein [Burkholderiales bacterium]|nr:DUF2909 domain-containing protein [Burkholderiales bacterium]MDE2565746.1 DUF2909 domain-containing protein [Burkholderiales bacterium]
MKVAMVLMLLAVLGALASAGFFMLRKDNGQEGAEARRSRLMARALAVRVALSVALFLFILLSWAMGWISPAAVPLGS